MVCVCPRFCSHDLFFGRFGATLKAHPFVADFQPIPGAFVPILTFSLRGVEVDLLLAVLPHLSTVPGTFDILEDAVLPDMDDKSRRSLNGPRDTLTIEKLVRSAGSHLREPPDADVRYEAFLSTVRVVRLWAKRRGLYSNKMGYLGGINFNILVAMIVQMYPRKGVGALLVRFFEVWNSAAAEEFCVDWFVVAAFVVVVAAAAAAAAAAVVDDVFAVVVCVIKACFKLWIVFTNGTRG
jgi:poly(A) polymerase